MDKKDAARQLTMTGYALITPKAAGIIGPCIGHNMSENGRFLHCFPWLIRSRLHSQHTVLDHWLADDLTDEDLEDLILTREEMSLEQMPMMYLG